ncbi:MAG: AAA family ATPase [Paracoccaceae bacterium]|nr:AAA family ATPase [Paracoccaceae bacterium]
MASATSVLLISDDQGVSNAVSLALSDKRRVKLSSENRSVASMNGTAVRMAAENDIVVFATDPGNREDLNAIRALHAERGENSIFLALTDRDITLARARALSDAGVDDVLPFPVTGEELGRQMEKWLQKVASSKTSGGHDGSVIVVSQARGGIGATTVAVNLADQLQARKGRFRRGPANSVAIVDLDLQFGAVGDFLDIEPQEGLMQLATGDVMPDQMWVEQSLADTPGGLSVLAAPADFMPLEAINAKQIESLIAALRATHDYVVVDMPRALVDWIEPVINSADEIQIVTDTTVPSIRATRRLMDFYMADNPGLQIEIVINHEKRPMMQAAHHKEAARVLEKKFEHWLPHDPKAARNAVDFGRPLSEVSPRSDLAKAIGLLARGTVARLSTGERASAS